MTRAALEKSLLALTLLIALGSQAFAGDAARLDILGFTEDGRTFAFEEFGVQDGSGFAYANRFYISTENDSFLKDTPIRVLLKDEQKSTAEARAEVRKQAETATGLADTALLAHAGETVGSNPVTELSANPHHIKVSPRAVFPAIDDPMEFTLEEIDVPQPDMCKGLGDVKGFRLVQTGPKVEGQSRVLHEDKTVPSSRGCPLGYRIGAVQVAFPSGGPAAFAVLVSVRRFGFEGPDHRWLAVTGRQ